MTQTKSAFIAIVGRPNVGKSSLLNALVGKKVAIVSDKPQTTRTRIMGVVTKGATQLVFLDTPGNHKPRTRLGDFMVRSIGEAVSGVDVGMLVTEPRAAIREEEQALVEQLQKQKIPMVLVINKIDTVEDKGTLLTCIAAWKERADFAAIIPVSALKGEGLEELLGELNRFAFDSPHFFPEDATSDQTEQAIAAEVIREKMLQLLRQEIPHGIAVDIERMGERETDNGVILDIDAYIYCEKDSHKGMVIGKKGAMLKEIATRARTELEGLFDTKVNLQCWVKVKEDWRNRQGFLNGLGYKLT
ncbi:MAG: GTPase Era [Clostridia bacterium]|nr:GTPase Era [Clostridia bacterium]